MRILYSHRVQSHDGQSVHIEELVSAFRKAGHEVLVVGPSLYDRVDFGGESKLVSFIRNYLPIWFNEIAEILYNSVTYRHLRKAYRDFSPDFIYERYNLYHLAGTLLRKRYPTRLFLEVNSPLADERSRFGNLRLQGLARRLEQYVWRTADRVLVVSNVLKEHVVAAGVSGEKVLVIPNGVDLERFPHHTTIHGVDTPLTIGFIGFIRDWHGLGDVITGLSLEPNKNSMRLLIAGDGPARKSLESQATTLGVRNHVSFLGVQQRQDIPQLISQFDIAVQPQSVSYASPLKLFEYMAGGRAIVAPDQPNICEILEHNKTALLFDPSQPGALWFAIKQLERDPRFRQQLGAAARRSLEERDYTWKGNALKITNAAAALRAFAGGAAVADAAPHLVSPHESV